MSRTNVWLPAALAAALVSSLAACTASHGDIQQQLDRSVMSSMVGRNYASATQAPPDLPLQPRRGPPYGHRFHTTELADGSRIHRHLIRAVGETARTNILGITSSTTQRFSYRLMYFRVDSSGVIVDTANAYWLGESERCVGYLADVFRACENAQALAADVAFFDALVRTSDGRTIAAWLPASAAPGEPVRRRS